GIVLHDKDLCIGCGYCFYACPFGAPQYPQATNFGCQPSARAAAHWSCPQPGRAASCRSLRASRSSWATLQSPASRADPILLTSPFARKSRLPGVARGVLGDTVTCAGLPRSATIV